MYRDILATVRDDWLAGCAVKISVCVRWRIDPRIINPGSRIGRTRYTTLEPSPTGWSGSLGGGGGWARGQGLSGHLRRFCGCT